MANKIFITGDTHGQNDNATLSSRRPPWKEIKHELDKEDYLIILGDFGLLWTDEPDKTEKKLTKWYDDKPYTTLFVDGNHENHPRLNALPIVNKFGGKVGKVSDSIYHLKRGEVYNIANKKFFAFGGAESIDKIHRTEGISWWPEEVPSVAEQNYGLDNLAKHGNKVDYIIAHTCPTELKSLVTRFSMGYKFNDPTTKYLSHVCATVKFNTFYFGHFHWDKNMGKYICLYNDIERII